MKKYKLCIVGATGLVGQTFLSILEERKFPVSELKLLASPRSAGKKRKFNQQEFVVEALSENSFDGYDIALFSAGGTVSEQYAPIARNKGLYVVDNSSAWRENPEIGLVVPEINPQDLHMNKIIANPNCSTIQSVLPLYALDKAFGINQVNYTTFQAVSGSGQKGRDELLRTRAGEVPAFYPYNISETAIPEIDTFLDNGYSKEEMKMVHETRKILHKTELPVSATCVRVPVLNAHAVSIQATLNQDFTLDKVREILSEQKGVTVIDHPSKHQYPTSVIANGRDDVYVGRLRKDLSRERSLLFYCTADNIRKGAALNAVQIAEKIIQEEAKIC
ncbi:aspartate-semialdehyde dehydrogenase [Lactovum odontotermitis]